MWEAEEVTRVLTERGEIWPGQPGLVGLRGPTLGLFRELEWRIGELARREAMEEWHVPPAIGMEALARADYFASFPRWLTSASHLRDEEQALARVATSPTPAEAAASEQAPAAAALSPAVCYHVYEAVADQAIESPLLVTVQGTCWRHEAPRFRPLERDWAFTMCEVVCIGSDDDVATFLGRAEDGALELASGLGLVPSVDFATDPFYAPTARGKELLQRIEGRKRELSLPVGADRCVAAASFNDHREFFGNAFGIRLPDGSPARTACLAFGLERWLLAFLSAHGPEPEDWPCALVAGLLESATPDLSLFQEA